MLFKRAQITSSGQDMPMKSRMGAGFLDNPLIVSIATDANVTLTTAQMSGGIVTFTGFTAGRNVATPTAAAILAEALDMDIGDAFVVQFYILVGFAATWTSNTGVTLAGRATTAATSGSNVVVTKTSATTVTWTVL